MVGDEGARRDGAPGSDRDLRSDGGTAPDGPDVVLELPEDGRAAFKDPFGPVYEDVASLLADVGRPIVAVGDMVTYHFEEAGERPEVAFLDGRTKRERAPADVQETVDGRSTRRIHVENPAGTVTAGLFEATVDALAADRPTTVVVDGEEDLAAVPAVLAAPDGATVVYGQPDEGMVAVAVTDEQRASFRELLSVFEGDVERASSLLDA